MGTGSRKATLPRQGEAIGTKGRPSSHTPDVQGEPLISEYDRNSSHTFVVSHQKTAHQLTNDTETRRRTPQEPSQVAGFLG